MKAFQGVFPAMITPFTDDGREIAPQRLKRYCEFLIGRGAGGLFPFGTTGEWPFLSLEERKKGLEIVLAASGGRVPVLAHAGGHTTDQTVELAAHAREAGAAGISVISPPFYPLDEQGLYEYFLAVAGTVPDLPVFLYNLPSHTGKDISPRLLERIARGAENVVGIKYSGESLIQFREYRRRMGREFRVFIGCDALILPSLLEGGDGIVSGKGSAFVDLVAGIYAAFKGRRLEEAARLQEALDQVQGCVDQGAELSSFKEMLRLRGVEVGEVRGPLRRLSVEGRAALRERLRALEEAGKLKL